MLGFGTCWDLMSERPNIARCWRSAARGRPALADQLPMAAGRLWVDVGRGAGAVGSGLQERAAGRGRVRILGVNQAPRMLDGAWRHSRPEASAWFAARGLEVVDWPEHLRDGVAALRVVHLATPGPGCLPDTQARRVSLCARRGRQSVRPHGYAAAGASRDRQSAGRGGRARQRAAGRLRNRPGGYLPGPAGV